MLGPSPQKHLSSVSEDTVRTWFSSNQNQLFSFVGLSPLPEISSMWMSGCSVQLSSAAERTHTSPPPAYHLVHPPVPALAAILKQLLPSCSSMSSLTDPDLLTSLSTCLAVEAQMLLSYCSLASSTSPVPVLFIGNLSSLNPGHFSLLACLTVQHPNVPLFWPLTVVYLSQNR